MNGKKRRKEKRMVQQKMKKGTSVLMKKAQYNVVCAVVSSQVAPCVTMVGLWRGLLPLDTGHEQDRNVSTWHPGRHRKCADLSHDANLAPIFASGCAASPKRAISFGKARAHRVILSRILLEMLSMKSLITLSRKREILDPHARR